MRVKVKSSVDKDFTNAMEGELIQFIGTPNKPYRTEVEAIIKLDTGNFTVVPYFCVKAIDNKEVKEKNNNAKRNS